MANFTKEDLQKETFLDIQVPDCYTLYKVHQKTFWIPEEIDLSNDRESFFCLSDEEQSFIKKISTFFLISDAVVVDNIEKISNNVNFREIKAFYSIQSAIEQIHIEVYGNIFETLIGKTEPKTIIDEILLMPSVIKKRKFCQNMDDNPAKLILSNTLVEGIFFSVSFSGILWLKKRGKCPGLVKANEWIARDERLHWRFGCEMFKLFFSDLLTTEEIHEIVEQVYQIEKAFVDDILETDIGDMTKLSLYQYVKFCCNEILEYMGIPIYFPGIVQPFEFMKFLNYPIKANFFESRVTNYSLPSDDKGFTYEDDKILVYDPLN
jgi:Ribonucleotide reductase, beta subunit